MDCQVSDYGVFFFQAEDGIRYVAVTGVQTCALPISVNEPVADYAAALDGGVGGLRIGVPREYFTEGVDPDVQRSVRQAIAGLCELGATTQELSLPTTDYGTALYYLIPPAEASSHPARSDAVTHGVRAAG